MEYKIDNIDFAGPLDLLLQLVKSNKCSIEDIFINKIIEQYITIIERINESTTELASEFIEMASTLIEIKSRYFIYLEDQGDEDNPAKDLFELLEEYKLFKEAALILAQKYVDTPHQYSKKGIEILIEEEVDLSAFTINDVLLSYSKYNKGIPDKKPHIVSYKKISVASKIAEIEKLLNSMSKIYFDKIVQDGVREDVVASLLGVLELTKEQRVFLSQKINFDNILIERANHDN